MITVHIVSCCDKKHVHTALAKDLYCSDRFLKIKKLISQETWYILSSLYGVCRPDEMLFPYESSIKDFTLKEKQLWRRDILADLKRLLPEGCKVIFWGGLLYRHTIVKELESRGHVVEMPLAGMDIGMQLKYLKQLVEAHSKKDPEVS